MRLDQWLWAVRLYRTRSLAVTAIHSGHVKIGEAASKPAHTVRPGELVTAQIGVVRRTYKVLGSPKSRVGAPLVPLYAEDLTPPEELAKAREAAIAAPALRPRGAGRPTKRERRAWEHLDL
ncbi:MAG TPA: S4 domain-containing protein [Candidatus Limnocylindria bacterium]|nr:S4 domain-containing protein [Candidatus Limnocylindria bacterium]